MLNKKLLCFFFIWVISNLASSVVAEDFQVLVLEKGSGVPVESATVVLADSEVFQLSSHDGMVSFTDESIPGSFKILAAGYETRIFKITKTQPLYKIYLEPLIYQAEGLEVVAERIREKGSKVALSKEELLLAPGSQGDPLKTITSLPGVVAAGDGRSDVYMRGSGTNENIVWINQAPVGYLYHYGGLYSTINPDLIEDLNVFLAGFPVEYGDALGGAIDARLRTPKNDRMHYKLDLSTYASAFLIEGPLGAAGGNDSFFLAGRRSYIDLFISPDTFNKAFGNDDSDKNQITEVPNFYDFQALYNHKLSQGNVSLYYFSAGDSLGFNLNEYGKSDPQLQGKLDSTTSYKTLGSTWQQTWTESIDQTFVMAWTEKEQKVEFGRDDSGNPFYIKSKSSGIYLRPELHWQQNTSQLFTAGVSYQYLNIPIDVYSARLYSEDDVDYNFTSQTKYTLEDTLDASSLGPYLKYRYQWTKDLATTLGLRYSYVDVSGGFEASELSPRGSVEYSLFTDTLLTASIGRYRQLPESSTIIDNYGNPGLTMTRSDHYVVGINQKLSELYSVKTEVYYKKMNDLVIALDDQSPPDNYANAGEGEAVGLDIFLRRARKDRTMGWVGFSLSDSKRTNNETGVSREFSGDQPYNFTAVWGQPFPGSFYKWLWSFKFQIHSGNPYTKLLGRHQADAGDANSRWIPEWGKHNDSRTPTYYKLDFRFDREFYYNEWKLKFYIDLQNVTNHKNVENYDYGSGYQDIDNPTEITGMGFMPFFGLEMEF
ncbi:MAG: TonB-dependent receptor [Pseudomonadota bacterium]